MSLFRKMLLALGLLLGLIFLSAFFSIVKHNQIALLILFASMVILLVGFSYWFIKYLLQPLNQLTTQANAICDQKFYVEGELPKNYEMQQLTHALNNIVVKLQTIFSEQLSLTEKLRSQAYLDSLTNFGNRKFFNQKVKHLLASEEDYVDGYFLLIEVKDLKSFNDRYGFQKGDELIKTIAYVLEQQLPNKQLYMLARIAGATFSCILNDITEQELSEIISNVLHSLRQHMNAFESSTSINIGATTYHYQMTLSQILSSADHALRQSQHRGTFSYWINNHADLESPTIPAMRWNEIILRALDMDLIVIYLQSIKASNNKNFHQEVYVKIKDDNGSLINAATFLPEAERFGLAIDLDKLVIKKIINNIKHYTNIVPFAMNLSTAAVYDKNFNEWLLQQINSLPPAKRTLLQFEITEAGIFNNLAHCEQLFNQLRNAGIKLGVDKVGANFLPIHYMHRLNLNYLKIDGSFTQGIEQDKDKQFFIYHLCQAANTLSIAVIATNVENVMQWQALQESQIQLGQGFYFEAPQQLDDVSEVRLKAAHG